MNGYSREVAVKKYVVRLSGEERARLEEFIGQGKRAAHLSTRALARNFLARVQLASAMILLN